MSLILPSYLIHQRRFKCPACQFAFIKQTPSQVEPCPLCKVKGLTIACIERGKSERDLDNYSQTKLRWYSQVDGKAHLEEIGNRKIEVRNGKEVILITDNKGRTIEEMPILKLPKKEPKFTSNNVQEVR